MHNRIARLGGLALIALAAIIALTPRLAVLAQQGGANPLAPSAQDPWTGVIMGRVIDDASGEGIGRAVITASSTTLPGGDLPTGGGGGRAVMTDARGRFLFANLPGSTFAITVEIRGYSPVDTVTTNRGAGLRVDLPIGGRMTDLAVRMWRHGAISGTVLDDARAPVVRQDVRAFRRSIVSGRSQFVFAGLASTDDRGMYRISGLRPGQYAIGTTTEIDVLPISTYDRYRSLSGQAASDFSRQILSSAGFAIFGSGTIVGDHLVSAFPPANAMPGDGGRLFMYPSTFYPDVRTPDQATIVPLASGEERSGVDLRLELASTVRVSGTVSGATGPVFNIGVQMYPASGDPTRSAELLTNSTATDQNGRFTFVGVTPGAYVLKILRVPPQAMSGTLPDVPVDPTLWARESIVVGNEDLSNVNLTVRTGFRIGARVEFVGRAPQPDRQLAQGMRYVIQPIDDTGRTLNGAFGTQLAFMTPELPQGRYMLSIQGKLKDWTFKSATTGGRDISDVPLDLRSDVKDLVLTFTDQPSQITGTVRNAQGATEPSATVLVFPVNADRWRDNGSTRSLQSAPASLSGTYLFRGLPAGEYYAVALTTPMADWQDPATLQTLSRVATRVTLGDGESRTCDLTANKPPAGSGRLPDVEADLPTQPHGPWAPETEQAQAPPRDRGVAPTIGTSRIEGRVVTDESPSRPLRHAVIVARSVDANVLLSAITEDDGRFVFSTLPAGRYTLTAAKAGYVSTVFGAAKPGMPGGVVVLTEGQRLTSIDLKVMPGAVITGRVNELPDMPIGRVTVAVLQSANVSGSTQWRTFAGTPVDDRGIYRIFDLPPGNYIVSATPTLQREIAPVAETEFDAVARGLLPARPGTVASPLGRGDIAPRPKRMTPIPVYYRSALDPNSAAVVTLHAGEERTGVDLDLQMAPLASIDVTILRPDGQISVDVAPSIFPSGAAALVPSLLGPRGRRVENGHFVIEGVPPGPYALLARASDLLTGASSPPAAATTGPLSQAPNLWAQSDVTVNGQDVQVTLQLQRGMTVSGRVVFDGQAALPGPVLLRLMPVITLNAGPSPGSATMKPDGTFEFVGVPPNRYRLSASLGNGGWSLRSALLESVDVLDTPFEVVPGTNPAGIVARFTDKPAQISGTLRDKTNAAAPGYFIVVFSTDREFWNFGSRRVRQTRPGTDGTFSIELPPGEYYLCALTELDPATLSDSSFLEQLVSSAIRIALGEGTKVQQDLKIGG